MNESYVQRSSGVIVSTGTGEGLFAGGIVAMILARRFNGLDE